MDIINKRYQINKKLKSHIPSVQEFLALDLWSNKQVLNLKILTFSNMSYGNLLQSLEEDFLILSNINGNFFIKNYGFASLFYSSASNIIFDSEEKFYICTTEHISNKIPILEFIQKIKVKDILEILVSVCQALIHLNNLGYHYNIFTLDNIYVVKERSKFKIKIKDFISTKLENPFAISKNKHIKKRKNNKYSKIIVELIISLLAGKQISSDYASALVKIKKDYNNKEMTAEEYKIFDCLFNIAKNLINEKNKQQKFELYKIISKINQDLNLNYTADIENNLNTVKPHSKFVGRKDTLEFIFKSRKKIAEGKPTKNVFVIRGAEGFGKTRLLRELEYRLLFKRSDVYSNYELKNKSMKSFWEDFINKSIVNANFDLDNESLNKIIKNLKNIKKINSKANNSKFNNDTFKTFNTVKKLIFNGKVKASSFIIIDDLHFADESLLQTLLYLTSEVTRSEKLGIIISYNESATATSAQFEPFIKTLTKCPNVEIIDLNNFSKEESIEMIENILLMKKLPPKFGETIYKQSAGHPKFITNIIQDLIEKKLLYRNKKTASWDVVESFYNKKIQEEISPNIKVNIEKQLNAISAEEKKVLSAMAMFDESFNMEHIFKLVKLRKSNLNAISQYFMKTGIIYKIKKLNKVEYIIADNKLKKIIYQDIPEDERKKVHKKISILLEKEENANFDELIWHLENCGRNKDAIKFCNENAKAYLDAEDFDNAIKYYQKTEFLIPKKNVEERCKILFNIFELYNKRGLEIKAKESLDRTSELIDKIKNVDIISEYYYLMAKQAHFAENISQQLFYLRKQKELYKTHKKKIIKLRLEHITCLYYQINQKYDKIEKLSNSMINISGDESEYAYFKGAALIFLGYINYYTKKYDKAVEIFEVAKEHAIKHKSKQIELVSRYNISIISLTIYGNEKESISFIKQLLKKTVKNDFISIGIPVLINYAWFLSRNQENKKAYKYAKKARIESDKHNLVEHKFESTALLIQISKNLNKYKRMIKYKKYFANLSKNSNFEDKLLYKFLSYTIFSEAYEAIGDYNKSYYYIKKAIQLKDYRTDTSINLIYFRLEAIKIIQKEKDSLEKFYELFEKYELETHKNNDNLKKKIVSRSIVETIIHLQIKRPDLNFEKIISKLLKYKEYCTYKFQKACITYFESFMNKKHELELLQKSLELSKTSEIYDLLILLYIKIAFCYIREKKINLAILNFLEAEQLVFKKLNNMPKAYKIISFSNSIDNVPFEVIEMFLNNKDISKYQRKESKISKEEFKRILKYNHRQLLNKNKEYKNNLIQEMKEEKGYKDYEYIDICEKIGYDYKKNIYNIMNFISVNLMASNFEVFINDNNTLTALFETEIKDKKIKKIHKWLKQYAYKKIKNLDDYFNEDSLIIPIKNDSTGNSTNETQGIMVFTSENIINDFSKEGIKFCKKYINLIIGFLKSNFYKKASIYDELTGSFTRKYFESILKNTYKDAKENNSEFSLILYDIDHFKNINDTYGHHIGDIVLQTITKEVMKELESTQILGRYGGEEFCIILPNKNQNEAFEISERLRKKIESLDFLENKFKLTISLGISCYSNYDDTVNKLLLKSDQALYNAKNTGRNKSCIWSYEHLKNSKNTNIITNTFMKNEADSMENILFLTQLMSITEKNISKANRINAYLNKIIKFFAGDDIALISLLEKNKEYSFDVISKIGFKNYTINEQLLNKVASTGVGLFQIDWDNIVKKNIIADMPEWNSIMIVPLLKREKVIGFIYLAISEKKHEFNYEDFNTLELIADIVSANL